jgi:sulfate adenylyltransferase
MAVTPSRSGLITPYGGRLVDLVVTGEEQKALARRAGELRSIQLSPRSLCDLELLATGGFSPLTRFMGERDYRSVLAEMRLADGTVFPIPLTLPVPDPADVRIGEEIALRNTKNDLLAVMTIDELHGWDLEMETRAVLGTTDRRHPLVAEMHGWPKRYASGPLRVLTLPVHHDFAALRRTPAEVRRELAAMGYGHVVAFQTRNPLHRSHEELTKRAAAAIDGALLIHPVVGLTRPGDVEYYTRVRSYKVLVDKHYDASRTLLSLLPLAMRMAGPREAVWHAIVRRNFGASHFIVGRDHAGPGHDSTGTPFYGPYDAQELFGTHADRVGVTMLPFGEHVYLADEDRFVDVREAPAGARTLSLSGTAMREHFRRGTAIPGWAMRPDVAAVLARSIPARHEEGFCVWFTGLSGAGKSTTAEVLVELLLEHGRQATVLDGDVVRTHLSKGLGFSREDRDTNIRRIGFVAAEIVRHGGVAICAAVSPYRSTRDEVRAMVGGDRFIEVFVDTPLGVCEGRDTKGLYAKARRGELPEFTGISDPYEPPRSPEIVLDTTARSVDANARAIVELLARQEFLPAESV